MSNQLPANIDHILKYLADYAAGYSTGLKWNEEAKLKSDLMENRHLWMNVNTGLIQDRLEELGMSDEDIRTVLDFVKRAQAGRRLVPEHSYKGFKFPHEKWAE